MNQHKPTDAEFLQQVYDELSDSDYVSTMRQTYEESFDLDGQFAVLIAAGIFKPDQIDEFKKLSDESLHLEKAFRGRFIEVIKESALRVIGPDREQLDTIPIGLLPTRELNASAIATPRGGAVIILNHGLIAQLAYVCRCTLAFISWNSEKPFCRDASQAAYAEALIGLAEYVTTSDFSRIGRHKLALRFPSLSDYDGTTNTFLQLMELFILLHEYGHVIKGHLQGVALRPAFGEEFPSLQEYTNSEAQEFEADEYAIEQLLRAGHIGGLRSSDVAFCAGLVMKFFELCELVASESPPTLPRTHPPASERWARIKLRTGLDRAEGALGGNLDPAFAVIENGWRSKPSYTIIDPKSS